MQFKEGTPVLTSDGQSVGNIERFVLNPRAREITALVVRKGLFFTEDKVIPVDMVQSTDENKAILKSDVKDPQEFPPFEETHYISPADKEIHDVYRRDMGAPLYYYPPFDGVGAYGAIYPTLPAYDFAEVTTRNIPEDHVAIKEGADVISSDGEHVGDVERIIADADTGVVTHFVITQGLLFKDETIVPAIWVSHASEEEVHLAVGSGSLENLPEYKTS